MLKKIMATREIAQKKSKFKVEKIAHLHGKIDKEQRQLEESASNLIKGRHQRE